MLASSLVLAGLLSLAQAAIYTVRIVSKISITHPTLAHATQYDMYRSPLVLLKLMVNPVSDSTLPVFDPQVCYI